MQPTDDIAAAARRVAADIRVGTMGYGAPLEDLQTLLPVLDAVAAGLGDEGRVERWRAAGVWGDYPAKPDAVGWYIETRRIEVAMALADAERAARRGDGFPALMLPNLPRPAVRYADDSYPAFSAEQMHAHAEKAVRAFAAALAPGALADAEAAAQREAGWRAYNEALAEFALAFDAADRPRTATARAALDAAVRALAEPETAKAPRG